MIIMMTWIAIIMNTKLRMTTITITPITMTIMIATITLMIAKIMMVVVGT